MRTAGLPSLLLLLSLLLIGTESNATDPPPGTVGQSTPTPRTTPKLDSQPNNNTSTNTGGGKPDSTATSNTTQTGPTLNPKLPEDSPKTKPTDAATVVTSAQGSTLGKEPVTTPSTNKTGQIEGNDVLAGQTVNRTNSTDLSDTRINTTEKDGKRKETGPTMAGPESSKAPETIVATSGPLAPKAATSPVNTDKHQLQKNEESNKAPTPKPPEDKKMLWILLPVLGVLVAGVIFVLKKYTKGHGGTDTAENGTENASYQSRSDNSKDGVQLLGVKTSEGEGNAAAR